MAAINLPDFLADKIRKAGEQLTAAVEKMPEDKLAWKPACDGNSARDALDQALECAYLNEWVAQGYQSGTMPAIDWNDYQKACDARRNKADAVRWLHTSTNALAEAIAAFPAEKLGDAVNDPVHDNRMTTWADFAIDLFYWNTVYHEGQVNYIQVLYGDLS